MVKRSNMDVNPQILTISTGIAGGVDDYVVAQINLPVPRIGGGSKTKAFVFEVLWVDWYIGVADGVDIAGTQFAFLTTLGNRTNGETSTLATAGADAADPLVFAFALFNRALLVDGGNRYSGSSPSLEGRSQASATGIWFRPTNALGNLSGVFQQVFAFVFFNKDAGFDGCNSMVWPIHISLMDGQGNGVLVATDRIFITGASVSPSVVSNYTAKIGYKLIEVGIQEYVGIVQSQSS